MTEFKFFSNKLVKHFPRPKNSAKDNKILEVMMDATIGTILVVGFPVSLALVLYLFGKFSVKPD